MTQTQTVTERRRIAKKSLLLAGMEHSRYNDSYHIHLVSNQSHLRGGLTLREVEIFAEAIYFYHWELNSENRKAEGS